MHIQIAMTWNSIDPSEDCFGVYFEVPVRLPRWTANSHHHVVTIM